MSENSELIRLKIGESLKQWLQDRGVSQKKVADDLGVSSAYVSGLCNGTKSIGKKQAARLAELYGVSEVYLLTGQGSIDSAPIATQQPSEQLLYQQSVQKANRIYQVLSHLVDIGVLANVLDAATVLGVMPSVVKHSIKYDPEGRYDFIIARIVHQWPQFSLEWLLTGDGDMITTPTTTAEHVAHLQARINSMQADMSATRHDMHIMLRRFTELYDLLMRDQNDHTPIVAEPEIPSENKD